MLETQAVNNMREDTEALGPGEGEGDVFFPKTRDEIETQTPTFSYYSRKRIVAEGLLDLGLLMANATQLKSLISGGTTGKFFWPILGATSLSIVLQIIIAIMLLVLGTMEQGVNSYRRSMRLHHATIILILIVTVINVFITAFGIEISSDI